LLISTQPGISYSEHNLSKDKTLTRMQLWLDACPERENPLVQKIDLKGDKQQLLASPDGSKGSLQLRQQVWLHHIELKKVSRRVSSFTARAPICSRFTARYMR
jgi:redox-sensitive bicupin YhaK (pirin superfamily)